MKTNRVAMTHPACNTTLLLLVQSTSSTSNQRAAGLTVTCQLQFLHGSFVTTKNVVKKYDVSVVPISDIKVQHSGFAISSLETTKKMGLKPCTKGLETCQYLGLIANPW